MTLSLLLALTGTAVVCASVARVGCARLEGEWEFVCSVMGRETLLAFQDQIDRDAALHDYIYGRALAARSAGRLEEALRLLGVALGAVEETTAVRLRQLRGMAVVSRMMAAVAPVPPVAPGSFHAGRARALAAAARVAHEILVTTGERLRLRVWLLGVLLGVVVRGLREGRAACASPTPLSWVRFGSGLDDAKAIDREALTSLGALVRSARAARKPRLPANAW